MLRDQHIYKLFADADSRIRTDLLQFNRSYNFIASSTFSYNDVNYLTHTFPSYFPSSYSATTSSATYVYATKDNNFSGYYYHSLMMLYKCGAINDFDGILSITSDLASNLLGVSAHNYGYRPINLPFDKFSSTSFQMSYLYIISCKKNDYGDGIRKMSTSAYIGNQLFAYDNTNDDRQFANMTIAHSAYTGNNTYAWLLKDYGKMIFWTDASSLSSSLSGISNIQFDNTVHVMNTTVHIILEGDEFNYSENPSFYEKFYETGKLQPTYFTSIGLFNNKDDLLAVVNLAKPMKKFARMPITIKLSLDAY